MNTRRYGQPTRMTLKEYLAALGDMSQFRLTQATQLPHDALEMALKDEPIAFSYAQKIAHYLAREYGRDIQVSDIVGLKTVNPGRERTQQAGTSQPGEEKTLV